MRSKDDFPWHIVEAGRPLTRLCIRAKATRAKATGKDLIESTIYPHHQITTNDAAKYSTTAKVEGDPKKAINFSKHITKSRLSLASSSAGIMIIIMN